ncbi:MAG TPA: DMT family transporter [Pseudomonadales bacterium]
MSVPAAYAVVIMIWASTPLAVQWSSDSLTPIAAVTARMVLALPLGLFIARLLGKESLSMSRHWRSYAAAALGLFPNMPLVYLAAQYIPSGLIAVLFGLSPFWVAVLSRYFLGEQALGWRHYLALLIAISGLSLIFSERSALGDHAGMGIALMLASTACFSLSSVLIQRYASGASPLNQLNGSLLFALPGLLVSWYCLDGHLPVTISVRSGGAVLYLAVIGSVIGFVAYFYLLLKLRATTVALIPLITPVLALLLGAAINDEPVSVIVWAGSGLIVAGLALFNGVRLPAAFDRYNAPP